MLPSHVGDISGELASLLFLIRQGAHYSITGRALWRVGYDLVKVPLEGNTRHVKAGYVVWHVHC